MPFILRADPPLPISCIDSLERKVRHLRKAGVPAKDIGVVLDFHGVFTNQVEQEDFMTLKGNIVRFLQYLKDENIPFVVATAWDKFDDVIRKGILKQKELRDFFQFSVQDTPLQQFTLGKESAVKLKGYVNGNVVALKRANSRNQWFRQKAFSLEAVYGAHLFKHVLCVDDSLGNLQTFEEDYKNTIYDDETKLTLLHLREMPPPPLPLNDPISVPRPVTPYVLIEGLDEEEINERRSENALAAELKSSLMKVERGTYSKKTILLNDLSSESSSASRSGHNSLKNSTDGRNDLKKSR